MKPNYGKLSIIRFTDCFGRPAERILNLQACVLYPVVSTRLYDASPYEACFRSYGKYSTNVQCYEAHLKESCVFHYLFVGRQISFDILEVYFYRFHVMGMRYFGGIGCFGEGRYSEKRMKDIKTYSF